MNYKMSLIAYTSVDSTLFAYPSSYKIFYDACVHNMNNSSIDAMAEWMDGHDNLCGGEITVALSLLHI
jgi:hypothetical protein